MSRLSNPPVRLLLAIGILLGVRGVAGAQGSADGFNPGANGGVNTFALQSDGKILVGGAFTGLGGGTGTITRNYIGRLLPSGAVDQTFNPGANSGVGSIVVQPDGRILVGGGFTALGGGTGTTPRSFLGRLNGDGTVDASFDPGANGFIYSIGLQADGKIVVTGAFTMIGGGGTGSTPRNYIARLNPDGSVDASYNPGANAPVGSLLGPDGRLLVGGPFTMLGGGGTGNTPRAGLGRINADGSLDLTFDPGTNGGVGAGAVQPDGKILLGGQFTMIGGGGTGNTPRAMIARLNPDGSVDSAFNPGVSGPVDPSTGVDAIAIQPDGKILVGGFFSGIGGGTGNTPVGSIGRLNPDGTVDTHFAVGANNPVAAILVQPDHKILIAGVFNSFATPPSLIIQRNNIARLEPFDGFPESPFNPGTNGSVYALAVQPDRQIVVGGLFTTMGGAARSHIGRITQDGFLDGAFAPGANDVVSAIAVQPDGKILVGGSFTGLGGGTGTTARSHIGRLNADGSVDAGFNPGANDLVVCLATQADGKIIVGGRFTTIGGGGTGSTARSRLARLNPDGSVDPTFDPGANGDVLALVLQANGQILVGGSFSTLGGGGTGTTPRSFIGRLNADGSLDASFNPGANGSVLAFAEQGDGRILVGGQFSQLGGGGSGTTARLSVGRLNADGSLDTAFNPGANGDVTMLGVQPDGEIAIVGAFTGLGGGTGATTRNRLGRLLADGTVDAFYNPGANAEVWAGALMPDGKLLVGGDFTTLGGGGTGLGVRNFIGQLNTADFVSQSISVVSDGTTVVWARSGAGPELSRVTFESSSDDVTFSLLGNAMRVPGGWQLTGISETVGQTIYIRARGYYGSGRQVGSGSILEDVEDVLPAPATSTLTHAPAGLIFAATKNGAGGALAAVTPAQNVTVGYTGTVPAWTVSTTTPWLSVAGGSGTGLAPFSVSIVNPNNVIGGSTSLSGSLTLSAPTAAPVTIEVTLNVQDTVGASAPPFGQIDTPVQNATGVQGAIPLTGWTLDDIGVTTLLVYRNCFPFDNPASCQLIGPDNVVFVGTGNFVAGARPDVEAAFPTYPEANRAGWGLLVLTNFLPHVPNQLVFGGQGTITLFVYATDVEGHQTLLGRTTVDHTPTSMTLDNDHIASPFGNIDVPAQSGTVSGTVAIFGWTITPDTDTVEGNGDILVPLNGSTVNVLVDGVPVGAMTYNQCRGDVGNPPPGGVFCDDDVSNAFGNPTPQPPLTPRASNPTKFRNLDAGRGAIGAFVLDTTLLANGQHTIVLQVVDSASRVAGIGSRFFTVANGGGSVTGSGDPGAPDAIDVLLTAPAMSRGPAASLDARPVSGRPVSVRTGYDPSASAASLDRTNGGVHEVTLPGAGRLEIGFASSVEAGYLIANGTLRDLPVGAHLDNALGLFTWTPPPAYFGTYHLVFLVRGERVLIDVQIR